MRYTKIIVLGRLLTVTVTIALNNLQFSEKLLYLCNIIR